jgi:hypothetical protein
MSCTKASRIFEQWRASLRDRRKDSAAVSSNFDDLFFALKEAAISEEEAHDMMSDALKAHLPTREVVKRVYQRQKALGKAPASEQDFAASWNDFIRDEAVRSFYCFYGVKPIISEVASGKIPTKEYRAQREYADSFPILTDQEITETMAKSLASIEEIENLFKDDDETHGRGDTEDTVERTEGK